MRKYLNIMEDMSKDIIKEELNSDDLMRIDNNIKNQDNYIKNQLVPQIKKIEDVNYRQTQVLSDILDNMKTTAESIQKMNESILWLYKNIDPNSLKKY